MASTLVVAEFTVGKRKRKPSKQRKAIAPAPAAQQSLAKFPTKVAKRERRWPAKGELPQSTQLQPEADDGRQFGGQETSLPDDNNPDVGVEWGHLKGTYSDSIGTWTKVDIDDTLAYGMSEGGFLGLEELDGDLEDYQDSMTGRRILLGPG